MGRAMYRWPITDTATNLCLTTRRLSSNSFVSGRLVSDLIQTSRLMFRDFLHPAILDQHPLYYRSLYQRFH